MKSLKKIAAALLLLMLVPLGGAAPAQAASASCLPILMYHDVTRSGEYGNLAISPRSFEEHMKWLAENGFTPLLPSELVLIAEGELPMPVRPVMITLDDGYAANYTEAYPILRRNGMRAVISVVSGMVVNSHYDPSWAMTWNELREMSESGLVEIGSHTFYLHGDKPGSHGAERLPDESEAEYLERVGGDISRSCELIERELGRPCLFFAYPFGISTDEAENYIREQGLHRITVTTQTRLADIADGLYRLPRIRVGEHEHVRTRPGIREIAARTVTAETSVITVSAGGRVREAPAYEINGVNYVRLRDAAYLLMGSGRSFSVGWDGDTRRVLLDTGKSYAPTGKELRRPDRAGSFAVEPRSVWTDIDGESRLLTAFNIGGENYFSLRWLGHYLGFSVRWDDVARTMYVE